MSDSPGTSEGDDAGLLVRVRRRRAQVIAFVRELDGAGVRPAGLPEGLVESLAEADAALARLEARLERGGLEPEEANLLSERFEAVDGHVRELQQELWKAAVQDRRDP